MNLLETILANVGCISIALYTEKTATQVREIPLSPINEYLNGIHCDC